MIVLFKLYAIAAVDPHMSTVENYQILHLAVREKMRENKIFVKV